MEITLYDYLTLLIPDKAKHFRVYDEDQLIIEGTPDRIIWSNDEYKGIPIPMLLIAGIGGKDDIIDIMIKVS